MRIKENLVLRRIGSENIIIVPSKDSVDLTEVYTLNETSVRIWEHFKNKDFTIEQIVEFVQEWYDVDQEKAMRDVEAFVKVLITGELIVED
jgi:hypothetical protein